MGVLKARVGGAWVPVSQGYSSAVVGIIAGPVTLASSQAVTSAGGVVDLTGLSVTFTAIAGHTYKTVFQCGGVDQSVAAGRQTAFITDEANTIKRNQAVDTDIAANGRGSFFMESIESGLSGQVTRKARFQVNAGTATVIGVSVAASYAAQLWVEDITQVQPADTSLVSPWANYTPQVDQGATTNIAKTVTNARYMTIGKLVVGYVDLTMTGAGTAASVVTVSLPLPIAPTGNPVIGAGFIYKAATPLIHSGQWARGSTSLIVSFQSDGANGNGWGSNPNLALAASDSIRFTFQYETS